MRDDFAVFILTHGRADNVKTLKALSKGNYTGRIYLVIDNEDSMADEYYQRYGGKVIQFDKLAVAKTFDTGDNFPERRTVIFARNACFDIAEAMGIQYFLELDDDYTEFCFRKIEDGKLKAIQCKQLDRMFELTIDFLEGSGALTVAYAQGGDFIGGKDNGNFQKGILRKAMNTFFCKTDRRFQFVGKINEDVTTYVHLGGKGHLFFTITHVNVFQLQTQTNKGGMSEMYLDTGTYLKSFYTVMFNPSCVTVAPMGSTHQRLHHRIAWNHAVPKIIAQEYKKK
jgi:hypothetical protein